MAVYPHPFLYAQLSRHCYYSTGCAEIELRVSAGAKQYFFFTACTATVGLTRPSSEWIRVALFPGLKRWEHEADHLLPSGAEFRNTWTRATISTYIFLVLCFVTHGNNLTGASFSSMCPIRSGFCAKCIDYTHNKRVGGVAEQFG